MPKKLIDLKPPKDRSLTRDERFVQHDFKKSAPFFISPSGVLAHRVRSLFSLTFQGSRQWFIVDYWCENNGRADSDVDDALAFDPDPRLVCSRCEANAVKHGLPTSSELAGRHVCVGVCRPVNICHPNDQN